MDGLGPICICHTSGDAQWSHAFAAELAASGVPSFLHECDPTPEPTPGMSVPDLTDVSMLLGVLSPESVAASDFRGTITIGSIRAIILNDEDIVAAKQHDYRRTVFVVMAPCEIPWDWGTSKRSYTVLGDNTREQNPDEAAQQVVAELKRAREDPELLAVIATDRARALSQAGLYDMALASIELALTLQPNDRYSWGCKADILCEAGLLDEGLEAYDAALAIEPGIAPTWILKGLRLAIAGRHVEALLAFDAATTLDPSSSDTWEQKGNAYLALSHQVEAFLMYHRALKCDESLEQDAIRKPRLLRNMAEILRFLGRHPGAAHAEAQAREFEKQS